MFLKVVSCFLLNVFSVGLFATYELQSEVGLITFPEAPEEIKMSRVPPNSYDNPLPFEVDVEFNIWENCQGDEYQFIVIATCDGAEISLGELLEIFSQEELLGLDEDCELLLYEIGEKAGLPCLYTKVVDHYFETDEYVAIMIKGNKIIDISLSLASNKDSLELWEEFHNSFHFVEK